MRRAPWVFEIRDLWPESAVTTGVLHAGGALTRLLYAIERWACNRADAIVTLTPAFTEDLVRRGLAPESKISCVPNGADLDLFADDGSAGRVRQKLGWGEKTVALYAGAHGRANAIGQLVAAAERLQARPDIVIATAGDGPERRTWQETAQAKGLKNLVFLGPQPKDRMPALMRAADIGLAVLQKNETFKTVYPNKVFDAMAAGRPIVLGIDGVARTLVCDAAGAGVFAEPENGMALAEAIRSLADDPDGRKVMGQRGLDWAREHADRKRLAAKYLALLEELAAPSAKAPVVASQPAGSRHQLPGS